MAGTDRDGHPRRASNFSHLHPHDGGSSSSDDDIDFVPGRKRGTGMGYTTFGDEDDQNDGMRRTSQNRRMKKDGRDHAIYGVFALSSGDEDERHPVRRRKRSDPSGGRVGSVAFVKSSGEGENCDDNLPLEDKAGRDAKEEKVEDTDARREREEREHRQKAVEDADAKFTALLDQARTRKKMRAEERTSSAVATAAADVTAASSSVGLGLGFRDNSGEGLGKRIPAMDGFGGSNQDYFHGGLGWGSKAEDNEDEPTLSSFVASSNAAKLGVAMDEGRKKKPKLDPSLGTWEKHTKGIGMKLLSKMGYSGSGGLGAKRIRTKVVKPEEAASHFSRKDGNSGQIDLVERKGISRAIEVVVRPANLGLGFGNFVEQSQLKVNRQIEAEVRGIDLKKQEEENRKRKLEEDGGVDLSVAAGGVTVSLLPSTQSLLSEGGWRKGAAAKTKDERQRKTRKFVSYEDVVKREERIGKEKIIDMRGPSISASVPSTVVGPNIVDGKVPLGEELLHNLTLLLNTYEEQVRTASYYVVSNQKKVESLKSEMGETERTLSGVQGRISKLERVLNVFDRMERLHRELLDADATNGTFSESPEQANDLISELGDNFTEEEKTALQFYSEMVPSLLEPIVQRQLKQWETFGANEKERLMMSAISLGSSTVMNSNGFLSSVNADQAAATKRSLFVKYILPRVKRDMMSSQWDPIENVESGIELYDATLRVAKNVSISWGNDIDENDEDILLESPFGSNLSVETKDLESFVRNEVMYDVIFARLSRSLALFKPSSSLVDANTGKLHNTALHLWILPWLPYLDYNSMLPTILPDIRRKLRSMLAFISRSFGLGKDMVFFECCINALSPWRGVIDNRTLHGLVSDIITPRLGSYLSQIDVKRLVSDQNWEDVNLLFRIQSSGILSNIEFLSLLEGEIICSWSCTMHEWLLSRDRNLLHVSELYAGWKSKLFRGAPKSSSVISSDLIICRHFCAVLSMISASSKMDNDALEDLMPPKSTEINYHSVLARRTKENRLREETEMRAKVATQKFDLQDHPVAGAGVSVHRGRGTATFRDVVEDFSRQNDIPFAPRMGANALKDGKQIFLFGSVPVYFDKSVVFALRGSLWFPTSFEDLVLAANA